MTVSSALLWWAGAGAPGGGEGGCVWSSLAENGPRTPARWKGPPGDEGAPALRCVLLPVGTGPGLVVRRRDTPLPRMGCLSFEPQLPPDSGHRDGRRPAGGCSREAGLAEALIQGGRRARAPAAGLPVLLQPRVCPVLLPGALRAEARTRGPDTEPAQSGPFALPFAFRVGPRSEAQQVRPNAPEPVVSGRRGEGRRRAHSSCPCPGPSPSPAPRARPPSWGLRAPCRTATPTTFEF